MSDISLCHGTDCSKSNSCLRFTQAPRIKWQSYLVMSVSIKDVDKCRFHIPNGEKDEQERV